jgi:hypothetical protein
MGNWSIPKLLRTRNNSSAERNADLIHVPSTIQIISPNVYVVQENTPLSKLGKCEVARSVNLKTLNDVPSKYLHMIFGSLMYILWEWDLSPALEI